MLDIYALNLLFYAIEKQRRSGPLLTWRVRLTGLISAELVCCITRGPFSSVLLLCYLLEVHNY